MDSITITLPLPHASLAKRARVHWAVRAKHTSKARLDGYIAAFAAGGAKLWWQAADAEIVWYSRTANRIDPTNMDHYLSAYWDGFEDAGVVRNDRDIHPVSHRQEKDAKNPRVEITLLRKAKP